MTKTHAADALLTVTPCCMALMYLRHDGVPGLSALPPRFAALPPCLLTLPPLPACCFGGVCCFRTTSPAARPQGLLSGSGLHLAKRLLLPLVCTSGERLSGLGDAAAQLRSVARLKLPVAALRVCSRSRRSMQQARPAPQITGCNSAAGGTNVALSCISVTLFA